MLSIDTARKTALRRCVFGGAFRDPEGVATSRGHKPPAVPDRMVGIAGGARTPACRVGTPADTQHFRDPEGVATSRGRSLPGTSLAPQTSAVRTMMAGIAGGARTPACRVGTLADTQHFRDPEGVATSRGRSLAGTSLAPQTSAVRAMMAGIAGGARTPACATSLTAIIRRRHWIN